MKKVVITFNGEIYNFKKLRKELESLGYHFDSQSDTEVDSQVLYRMGNFHVCKA
jgi:asparagine synthase (glutamine-hydrolysing)